jgi:hypothetical protein
VYTSRRYASSLILSFTFRPVILKPNMPAESSSFRVRTILAFTSAPTSAISDSINVVETFSAVQNSYAVFSSDSNKVSAGNVRRVEGSRQTSSASKRSA